ncbi:MAG: formylglycine-generating enzyme family protein [Desulfovibrio sp.]|jgi:formylglycine-generating enzyme required for sulfatase activity|nr:formylglycine-generating enzyme family protein [Desulfovibrio sp.]
MPLALVLLLTAFFLAAPAGAEGLRRANQDLSPDKAWNPVAHEADLILPMPCEGLMIFRAAAVPARGLLYDKKVFMGVRANNDSDRELYEHAYESYISGPFTYRDLPADWQKGLKAQEKDSFLYYFLGKYEVSVWQWQAVMDDVCPKRPINEDLARPVSSVTWLQMQEFMHKYTIWLLENHKDSLPCYVDNDKDVAFLRLPTEEEWEFAARGGLNVPEEHRNQEDFHPLGDKRSRADFGVFQTAEKKYDGPLPIGSRNPNPLQLFDMAGNVKELVQSSFQFSIPEMRGNAASRRLHGSSGGLVVKGGSYAGGESEVLPGRRDEVALFNESGPVKMKDLGFRLALSGINTPASASRLRELKKESTGFIPEKNDPQSQVKTQADSKLESKDDAVKINPAGKLASELEKIMAATASPLVRSNLEQYRRMVLDYEKALEREQDGALLNKLRSLLYQIEALRSIGVRFAFLDKSLKEIKDTQSRRKFLDTMEEYKAVLTNNTNNYKNELVELARAAQADIERHSASLFSEYKGRDLHSQHMRENLDNLRKHLEQVKRKGAGNLSKEDIWRDVIYEGTLKIIQGRG